MSESVNGVERPSRLPLFLGLLAFIILGGAGFYAVFSGYFLASNDNAALQGDENHEHRHQDIRFVQLEPLLVSINRTDPPRQLRLEAQLEVTPSGEREVESQIPRIMDAMNSYLRAVEMTDLREPAALLRMRAQLLRRIQVIAGDGLVQGLLITKFLVS